MALATVRVLATSLLCATAIVTVAWLTIVAEGFAAPDESWYLQVVARLQAGQTLYRDVYFNATPLSVYVTLGLTSLFPTELALVRSVVAAALIVTVTFCWLVCRLLHLERFAPWLLVCAWTQPAPYTPVAMAFFAASFYATVLWMQRVQDGDNAPRSLARAGVCAALCFSAKQNLGLYCLGAVLLSVWLVSTRGATARRHGVLVLASFLLTGAAVLLPVVATGGLERFIVYGFAKTTYLATGGVPYSAPIERFLAAASGARDVQALAAAYREIAFLIPPVVFVLVGAACLRSRSTDRQTALVVFTFVGTGYLVVYPGQGGSSIMFAIPVLVVGLAFGWSRVRHLASPRWARIIPVVLTLLFVAQIGLRFVRYGTALVSPEYATSSIPHFRGLRVRQAEHTTLQQHARLLSTLAGGKPLLLVGPNAGFYYLAADLQNPAAFDFPYVSVFGRTGQQEVISRIVAGEIGAVFIFSNPIDRQTPLVLHEFVRSSMVPVRSERVGTLYRRDNEW